MPLQELQNCNPSQFKRMRVISYVPLHIYYICTFVTKLSWHPSPQLHQNQSDTTNYLTISSHIINAVICLIIQIQLLAAACNCNIGVFINSPMYSMIGQQKKAAY